MRNRKVPPPGANFVWVYNSPKWDFQYNVTKIAGVVCRVLHVIRHKYLFNIVCMSITLLGGWYVQTEQADGETKYVCYNNSVTRLQDMTY